MLLLAQLKSLLSRLIVFQHTLQGQHLPQEVNNVNETFVNLQVLLKILIEVS